MTISILNDAVPAFGLGASYSKALGGCYCVFQTSGKSITAEINPYLGAASSANAMFIMAGIHALESIPEGEECILVSSSNYFNSSAIYMDTWEENGWLKADGDPPANLELWKMFKKLKDNRKVSLDTPKALSSELFTSMAKAAKHLAESALILGKPLSLSVVDDSDSTTDIAA